MIDKAFERLLKEFSADFALATYVQRYGGTRSQWQRAADTFEEIGRLVYTAARPYRQSQRELDEEAP